jgi:hypothetical protein
MTVTVPFRSQAGDLYVLVLDVIGEDVYPHRTLQVYDGGQVEPLASDRHVLDEIKRRRLWTAIEAEALEVVELRDERAHADMLVEQRESARW